MRGQAKTAAVCETLYRVRTVQHPLKAKQNMPHTPILLFPPVSSKQTTKPCRRKHTVPFPTRQNRAKAASLAIPGSKPPTSPRGIPGPPRRIGAHRGLRCFLLLCWVGLGCLCCAGLCSQSCGLRTGTSTQHKTQWAMTLRRHRCSHPARNTMLSLVVFHIPKTVRAG